MTLGQLLDSRIQALGYTGAGARARFAALLRSRGVKASDQSVSAWVLDRRRPELPTLIAVLDTLRINDEARELAIRLAALPTVQPTISAIEATS